MSTNLYKCVVHFWWFCCRSNLHFYSSSCVKFCLGCNLCFSLSSPVKPKQSLCAAKLNDVHFLTDVSVMWPRYWTDRYYGQLYKLWPLKSCIISLGISSVTSPSWISSWYDIELKLAAHTYVYPPLLPFKRLLKKAIVRIEFAILVIIFSWKCVYLGGLYSDSVNRALAPYLLTSINFTDHLFWP